MTRPRSHAYVTRSDDLAWQFTFEEVVQTFPTWREAFDRAFQIIRIARIIREEGSL